MTSIARVGTVVTATHATAHGLAVGSSHSVVIYGATPDRYNGSKNITVTTTTAYTWSDLTSPDTPATGTITATYQIVKGNTNTAGVKGTYGFNYTNDQPIIGKARKAIDPYYKTVSFTGTITSAGFSTNVFLVPDE